VLGVRAGLQVGADNRQAVGCLGDRNFGALQQELSVQGPFEPSARLRAVLLSAMVTPKRGWTPGSLR
jgi:hypothetical protein